MAITGGEAGNGSTSSLVETIREKEGSTSQETVEQMEEKCHALRRKLLATRRRRVEVLGMIDRVASDELPRWLERRNQAERRRSAALDQYRLTVSRCDLESSRLDAARKWSVTNDCFYIWRSGPFGTINGLRLGSEVSVMPSTGISNDDDTVVKTTSETTTSETSTVRRLGSLWGDTNAVSNTSVGNDQDTGRDSELEGETGFKVPWVETNSALGLVALLLSTLEQKQHSRIRFTNEVVPMGSCSKIGFRRGESSTLYNLYSDDSFQFFGKRNFNIALNGLLGCVADASDAVLKRDRTIALPHSIETSGRGEYTIGGLSVSYGTDGERWTRAMKFLLTDLKWLVAFTTKHVDR